MKRKCIKTVLALGTLPVLLTGCSSEDVDHTSIPETTSIQLERDEAEQEVFDSALAQAVFLINSVDKTRAERSVPARNELRLQSLRSMSKSRSSSASGRGDIYAVNFGDDEGFSIIGTVNGVPNVYAYSSTGSFSFDPMENCAGVNSYVEWLETQADLAYRWPNDTAIPDLPNPPKPPVPWPGNPVLPDTKVIVAPLLPGTVANWGQGNPYNIYTPEFGSLNAYTGCAAVACAMVMATYQWPKSYEGYQYDWEAMIAGTNTDMVAALMVHLGYKKNLDMNYGDPNKREGSEALASNIPRTFENFGYRKPSLVRKFDGDKVYQALMASHPVIVGGKNEKRPDKAGHGWVLDGLMFYYYNDLADPSDPESKRMIKTYHHCVWGGSGYGDGWYNLVPPVDDQGTVLFNPYSSSQSYEQYSAMSCVPDISIK